jgi:hypothetical protein
MATKTTLDDLKRALKELMAELRPAAPPQDDAAAEAEINKLFAQKETP